MLEGHSIIDMDREQCDAGQDQDILNIPFIDDNIDEDGDDDVDDNDEKVRRKEGMTRRHDKLSTIQQSK